MTSRAPVTALLLVVAGVLAACSSTSSSTSTTTSAPATTTSVAPSTTTIAPSPPWCAASMLSITTGGASGAAGHVQVSLSFTNTSSTTCRTGGFPGVAGTDASGTQVLQATRTGGSNGVLTLAPGKSATAALTAVNVPSGTATSCTSLTGLLVTPPNTVAAAHVAVVLPGCPGMTIAAMAPGP